MSCGRVTRRRIRLATKALRSRPYASTDRRARPRSVARWSRYESTLRSIAPAALPRSAATPPPPRSPRAGQSRRLTGAAGPLGRERLDQAGPDALDVLRVRDLPSLRV